MTETDLERIIMNAVAAMKLDRAPEDTRVWGGGKTPYRNGNLAGNAIKVEHISPWVFRVFVDKEIAPYMKFLNDRTSSRHYQWWSAQAQKLMENIKKEIENQSGGTQV